MSGHKTKLIDQAEKDRLIKEYPGIKFKMLTMAWGEREVPVCRAEGCTSHYVSEKSEYWCHTHMPVQLRELIAKEKAEKKEAERKKKANSVIVESGTKSSKRRTKEERADGLTFFDKQYIKERNKLHKILGDKNFDAEDFIEEMEEVGGVIGEGYEYLKKLTVLKWYMSDPETRRPKDLEALAKLLKVSKHTLIGWTKSDWFVEEMDKERLKMMKWVSPFIDKVVVAKALAGDMKAIQEFYKNFKVNEGSGQADDIFEKLPDKLKAKAYNITGDKRLSTTIEDKVYEETFLDKEH